MSSHVSEIVLRADPAIWSPVPHAHAEINNWIAARVASAPADTARHVEDAARLALYATLGSELSLALLLTVPSSGIYGMLGVLGVAGAPAPSNAEEARDVAEALLPSPWGAEMLAVDLGTARGWRATVLDPVQRDDDGVALPQTVSTAYVLDVDGRCVVAALSPLAPLAAAAAQVLAQRALSTIDVSERSEV